MLLGNRDESTEESMRMSQIIWESSEMDKLRQFVSCNSKEREKKGKRNNVSGS